MARTCLTVSFVLVGCLSCDSGGGDSCPGLPRAGESRDGSVDPPPASALGASSGTGDPTPPPRVTAKAADPRTLRWKFRVGEKLRLQLSRKEEGVVRVGGAETTKTKDRM